jgi:hypothetical protein
MQKLKYMHFAYILRSIHKYYFHYSLIEPVPYIQAGPDITCQKNSGSLEGSNKSKKPLFIRSKIMGKN